MNKKTVNLELDAISYLFNLEQDELREVIFDIDHKYWHRDHQEILNSLREYCKINKPETSTFEHLLFSSKHKHLIISLSTNFVPPAVGRKLLKEIKEAHDEIYIKGVLKSLENKSLDEIGQTLLKLKKIDVKNAPETIGKIGQERVYEKKLEREAPSTGYRQLDQFITGFVPGHVYTLSGDTNAGKSTLALNFTYRISKQGKKVLYFALEPENTVVDYLASIRLKKRFEELTDSDILFDDENIFVYGKDKVNKINQLIDKINSLDRFDLVIIDHIGYFTSNSSNLVTKQSDVMKEIAGLAKSKKCAILLIQHLNKSRADKSSPENNITGSAAFKQDATDVLILTRDKEEDIFGSSVNKDTGAIMIRKSKTAKPQGVVPVRFISGTALILDDEDILNDM
jgi:replicative DNA helicase